MSITDEKLKVTVNRAQLEGLTAGDEITIDVGGYEFPLVLTGAMTHGSSPTPTCAVITAINQGNPDNIAMVLANEFLMGIHKEIFDPLPVYAGPIFTLSTIPKGTIVWIEGLGICVNPEEQAKHFVDNDGDRGYLVVHPTKKQCIFIKFPHTDRFTIVYNFIEFKEDMCDYVEEAHNKYRVDQFLPILENSTLSHGSNWSIPTFDEQADFIKSNMNPNTGLTTYNVNLGQLHMHSRITNLTDKMIKMLQTGFRGDKIEREGMKQVRKDGINMEIKSYIAPFKVFPLKYRIAFSPNNVLSLDPEDKLDIIKIAMSGTGERFFRDLLDLKFTFIQNVVGNGSNEKYVPPPIKTGIFQMLVGEGLLKFKPIPHYIPGQFAYIVELCTPEGHLVALTEAKRDSTLSYGYIVYPTMRWSMEKNRMDFVPIEEIFEEAIDAIPNIANYMRPRSKLDFYVPNYKRTLDNIQNTIIKVCGIYGEQMPLSRNEETEQLFLADERKHSLDLYRQVVCLDYLDSELDVNLKWRMASSANKVLSMIPDPTGKIGVYKLAISGGKSQNYRVKRLSLCRPNGVPFLAHKYGHPRRVANGTSTQRSGYNIGKRKCFICKTGGYQVFSTISGTKAQEIPNIFLNSVSPIPKEGHVEKIVRGWTGVHTIYQGDSRQISKMGKIVSPEGIKSMVFPLACQGYDPNYETGTPESLIDFIIPEADIMAPTPDNPDGKNLVACYLKETSEPVKVLFIWDPITGREPEEIEGYIVDIPFVRTGAYSENIKASKTVIHPSGIDGYFIKAMMTKLMGQTDFQLPIPKVSLDRLIKQLDIVKKVFKVSYFDVPTSYLPVDQNNTDDLSY